MAAIVITAANVVPGTGAKRSSAIAGEAIDAGEIIYISSSTALLAISNDTAAKAAGYYMAANSATTGQPVGYFTEGQITVGAVLTAGHFYMLTDTAGKIEAYELIATGDTDYQTLIGYAASTSIIQLNGVVTGLTKA